jgi:hypothetical protein
MRTNSATVFIPTPVDKRRGTLLGTGATLLLGILWAALAICVLGALAYDIRYWLEGW